jgi:imidazolonepropionase-like amidohydrolase
MPWYFASQARLSPTLELCSGVRIEVTDDGRIAALERGRTASPGDVRLPGTVVPGLIDLHVHLALDGGPDVVASLRGQHPDQLRARAVSNAAAHLSDGVTSVRDLGAPSGLMPAVLEATPLRVSWAAAITPPGGHGHFIATEAGGAAATREAVEAAVTRGAHWIKVFATGGVITAGSRPGDLLASREELETAVETAHVAGLRVAAHAHGTAGILAAISAGCDTVEHVSDVDDRVIEALRSSDATAVSTLVATERFVTSDAIESSPQETVRKIREHAPREAGSLRRLQAAGLTIGAGTDAGTTHNPHGQGLAEEAQLLRASGLEPLEVLRTLTAVNARFVVGPVGWLAAGMRADLAAFDGDPGVDVEALFRPRCTIVGGEVVSGSALAAAR